MEFTRIPNSGTTTVKNVAVEFTRKEFNSQASVPEETTAQVRAAVEAETEQAVKQARETQKQAPPVIKDSKMQFREELNRLISLVQNEDGEYESRVPPEEVLETQARIKQNAQAVLGTLFEQNI